MYTVDTKFIFNQTSILLAHKILMRAYNRQAQANTKLTNLKQNKQKTKVNSME